MNCHDCNQYCSIIRMQDLELKSLKEKMYYLKGELQFLKKTIYEHTLWNERHKPYIIRNYMNIFEKNLLEKQNTGVIINP